MSRPAPVGMRDAATVMILRDGAEGLEVFMLKRNLNSDFVGGAYVFPGGAVDPADREADLEAICEGRTDAQASTYLGVTRGGLAYWVAAIRESFEEAGLLLAYGDGGEIADLDAAAGRERWVEHRTAVDSGARRLIEVAAAENLRLAVDRMHYFAHWITPEGAPRRYDTRFFLAAAPENQTPVHDDRETVANEWIRPADGLQRVLEGALTMMPPTIASLRAITRFATVREALSAAEHISDVPPILPRVIADAGGVRIVLPGEPGYDGHEPVEAQAPPGGWLANIRTTALDPDPTLDRP